MQISKIVTDGNARDEALKRRNSAMRETLGMGPASKRETKQPDEPKADEKSSDNRLLRGLAGPSRNLLYPQTTTAIATVNKG
jgi:hypothetical protein